MNKKELKQESDKKLNDSIKIYTKLNSKVKKDSPQRSLFNNAIYREIAYKGSLPVASIEAREGTPQSTIILNIVADSNVKESFQYSSQLFQQARQTLVSEYEGKVDKFIVSVPLSDSYMISYYNNLGFKLINDKSLISRNRLVSDGTVANLILSL
jgi:hypothetical protein